MEVESGGGGPNPIAELVTALEQATLMAKQLPVAADPSRLHHIHSSLHLAQLRLSSFLSRPPPPTPPPPSAPENSLLSAVPYEDEAEDDDDRNGNGNSPMQVADDDNIGGGGELHPETIERVEERMRDCCFIQNKRPKRPLSPSADHQPRSSSDTYLRPMSAEFDPHRTRLRSLDLVSQFHA